ncbi:MAG: ATP-binding cassette domain-containing protein [Nitrososphaerota archaeon]|nr:ATP-binding cassette domain-containing protein [Nitrososphaerales archaeon]MDW8044531.1 ATP-binding cassette domain-containing protein [Nitrososphaerota archaeon]
MSKLISIKDYSFTYAGSSKPALTDVNLDVGEGEMVIIAGPSGCGKSTLLRSLIGLIPHMYSGIRSGSVIVDGLDVSQTPISELAKRIGFVFQNPENQIFMFSVERDVAFGLENLQLPRDEIQERVRWACELLGITDLMERAPYELSDGQKQRVALAGVIAMKPRILILDEPTSLLDPYTARELIDLVKKLHDTLEITVLIVEHRLDLLLNVASRIVVMNEGRIILDGRPEEVLTRKEVMLIGVSVPTIIRLQNLLREAGVNLGRVSLSTIELADRLNVILRDNI